MSEHFHSMECDTVTEESNKAEDSLHDDSDEDLFSCQLGFFGQVVLSQRHTDAVLSRFEFCYPPNFIARNGVASRSQSTKAAGENCRVQVDEDGDLVVPRRKGARNQEVVVIEHQQSTSLSLVGEQVWRGALFLADFLLHSAATAPQNRGNQNPAPVPDNSKIKHKSTQHEAFITCNGEDTHLCPNGMPKSNEDGVESNELCYNVPPGDVASHLVDVRGKRVLEVASGVGLTSIIAAMVAESVLVTDINRGNILRLIERNLEHNRTLIGGAHVAVGELDFCNLDTIDKLVADGRLRDIDVILAADVVYNNDLTDAFFDAVHCLLSRLPDKTLLVALEKRYVFTTTEYDVVAPCYDYFLHCLDRLRAETSLHPRVCQLFSPKNISPKSTVGMENQTNSDTKPLVSDSTSCNGVNGLSSTSSRESGKLSNGFSELDSVQFSLTAEESNAPRSNLGVVHDLCSDQSREKIILGNLGGKNAGKEVLKQQIKYSVKKLQYDNFPQYFAYDRTKELVLWKIDAQIS